MINNLPTIYEVVTGTAKKQTKEKTPKNSSKSNKSGTKPPRQPEPNSRGSKMSPPKDEDDSGGEEDEEEDDHENTLCGSCGDNYGQDEFWICCDACETWFHGKCVKITPAKAEHIKHYKCPNCSGSSKRARAWSWWVYPSLMPVEPRGWLAVKHPHGTDCPHGFAFSRCFQCRTSCRVLMCCLLCVKDILDLLLLVTSN